MYLINKRIRYKIVITSSYHERKLPAHPSEPRKRASGRITCTHPPESPYGKHSDEPEGKPQPNTTCTHIQQWGSHPLSLAGRHGPASPAGGLGPAAAKSQTPTKTQSNHTEETPTRIRAITRMVRVIADPKRIVPEIPAAQVLHAVPNSRTSTEIWLMPVPRV